MTETRLIRPEEYRVIPWKNGQGTTAEIAMEPGAGNRFRWRLSIADVGASGPFSDFAGYDRVIAVASGAGMRLAVAGRAPLELTQDSEPYAFPGEAATECTLLQGPIRDFNLMTDRATGRGRVTALRFGGGPVTVGLWGGIVFLYATHGAAEVEGYGTVPEGATLRIDAAQGALAIRGETGGCALLAEIMLTWRKMSKTSAGGV
jgi:environmental stress-induced protein Ves